MQQSKGIILTIIIACQLLVVLDASVMVTSIPEIGRSLHMSTVSLTWVQNSYILAFGGFLLLGARAGDLLGRRRMLGAGIGLFTLTSLLAGLAPTAEVLLVPGLFKALRPRWPRRLRWPCCRPRLRRKRSGRGRSRCTAR